MRKVVMFSSGGLENGGGIGRMVGYMIAAWQARPDPPEVVVVDTRGPARSPLMGLRFLAALGRLAREGLGGRGLVHVHVAGRGSTLRKVLVMALARAVRLRTVLHLHDYDYAGFFGDLPAFLQRPVRAMFRRADTVVVLGRRDQETVATLLGVERARIFVIPNSVPDPGAVRKDAPSAGAGSSPEPLNIVFLGALSRRKGVHDLLAALASERLRPSSGAPPWRAVLAGGGPEAGGFQDEARRLGLEGAVAFPGWVGAEETGALLARADVLVLPSYAEGLAMAVLEAMSWGLCIVCTPVGAIGEAVEDEVSALLVPPGDPPALAAALRRVLEDAGLRSRLGAGARRRFEAQFHSGSYPDRIEEAYRHAAPDWSR